MKRDFTRPVEPAWISPVRKYAPVALIVLIGALLTQTVFIPMFSRDDAAWNLWTWTGVITAYLGLGGLAIYLFVLIRDMNTVERSATEDIDALFKTNEQLSTILHCIADGVITTNDTGQVLLMNEVAEHMTGWTQKEAAGRKLQEVFQLFDENTHESLPAPMPQLQSKGRRFTVEEHAILTARDRTERIVSFSSTPLLDADRWLVGAVIVFRDDSALRHAYRQRESLIEELSATNKKLRAEIAKSEQARRAALNLMQDAQQAQNALRESEDQLRQINERLRESNHALEEYAHVASHDLQEPLRKIESFTSLFLEDYGSKVDAQGRQYLDVMVNAAQRMRRLIKDVLTLAEAGASERPFTTVSLDRVVNTARDNLSERIQERSVEIIVHSLPTVMGDETQLVRLFQNLLSNALKFNDKRQPRIEIKSSEEDTFWKITVQDNGIGMNPAEAGKIFAPFKRLHGRNEYEGTGIGLAVCRKIIHRHGGTIGVDSQPGLGSTFWLTIPRKELEDNTNAGGTGALEGAEKTL
jgi:PAS domain S-box-containing protein